MKEDLDISLAKLTMMNYRMMIMTKQKIINDEAIVSKEANKEATDEN